MKVYAKYRPSGVDLVGSIPDHWELMKIKYLIRNKITDGPHETPVFLPDGIPFLSVDGIQNGQLQFEGCRFISKEDHQRYQNKCVVEKTDILMGKAASIGKIAQVKVDFEFSIWSPLALIKPRKDIINPTFLEYFLKSPLSQYQIEGLCTSNTQKNISMDDIPKIVSILPPIEEQDAIASYLDQTTAQLDTLIAKKQQLNELLREERTAIINQAVTKGINPKVKLKPSGIEWLGDIPEHWEVKRMTFYVGYVKGYAFNTELFQPDGMPVIKASDIKNLTIRKGKDFLRPDIVEQFEKVKLKTGDIIISTVGSTPDVVNSAVGQVARVPEEFNGAYLNQNTVKFYSFNDETFANDMLFYTLISNPYRKYLDLYAHGTANQASLNIEDMLNFSVAITDDYDFLIECYSQEDNFLKQDISDSERERLIAIFREHSYREFLKIAEENQQLKL